MHRTSDRYIGSTTCVAEPVKFSRPTALLGWQDCRQFVPHISNELTCTLAHERTTFRSGRERTRACASSTGSWRWGRSREAIARTSIGGRGTPLALALLMKRGCSGTPTSPLPRRATEEASTRSIRFAAPCSTSASRCASRSIPSVSPSCSSTFATHISGARRRASASRISGTRRCGIRLV